MMVIFIVWIVFIRLEQKINLLINFFFGVEMPSEEIKILEFNQYQKSCKTRSIIYADFESLIKK